MSSPLPAPAPSRRFGAAPIPALLEAGRLACLLAARALGRAARHRRDRARREEDRTCLRAMSARDLNDLGIGRSEVEYVTAAPGPSRRLSR
jgi:uncharacterized protein YjiS (DUF1127 family)